MRAHYSQRPQTNRLVEPALWINSIGQSCDWGHEAGRRRKKARGWGRRSRGRRYSPSARRDAGGRSHRREAQLSYLARTLAARRPPLSLRPADRQQGPGVSRMVVVIDWGEYVEASTAENLRVPRPL